MTYYILEKLTEEDAGWDSNYVKIFNWDTRPKILQTLLYRLLFDLAWKTKWAESAADFVLEAKSGDVTITDRDGRKYTSNHRLDYKVEGNYNIDNRKGVLL